jgi:hypothetical protein
VRIRSLARPRSKLLLLGAALGFALGFALGLTFGLGLPLCCHLVSFLCSVLRCRRTRSGSDQPTFNE